MKAHPEWYSDFDSLDAALEYSAKNHVVVYAWVGVKAYLIYPGGRNQRRPHDDKVECECQWKEHLNGNTRNE